METGQITFQHIADVDQQVEHEAPHHQSMEEADQQAHPPDGRERSHLDQHGQGALGHQAPIRFPAPTRNYTNNTDSDQHNCISSNEGGYRKDDLFQRSEHGRLRG